MRAAEQFFSDPGICDAKSYDRLASMDRGRAVRREVLQFALGMLVGFVLLLVMAWLDSPAPY